MDEPEIKEVRGLKGIKTMVMDIAGKKINIAVAHGLANVEELMEEVRAAKAEGKETPYHFIEVMACEGGCVGGGGQPYGVTNELRKKRAAGLYKEDESLKERSSFESAAVNMVYKEFIGEPNGAQAHKLLHNHYERKPEYKR